MDSGCPRLTYNHDDKVQHLLNQGVLLDKVLWSKKRHEAGPKPQDLWGYPEPEQSEPTLLASLNLFLMSAELKIWNSSNRLRTIIKKWFGSIMDAPACTRTNMPWTAVSGTSRVRQNQQMDVLVAWWCPCQTSPVGTWRCGSSRSERSGRPHYSCSQTSGFDKQVRTHLVNQREAVPSPHPSMHLGTEHQAAQGEFDEEVGA